MGNISDVVKKAATECQKYGICKQVKQSCLFQAVSRDCAKKTSWHRMLMSSFFPTIVLMSAWPLWGNSETRDTRVVYPLTLSSHINFVAPHPPEDMRWLISCHDTALGG
jgi:hypothetical protein